MTRHNPSNSPFCPLEINPKPLSRLACLILPIILIIGVFPIKSHALDVAIKTGLTSYAEERPSKYIGNNCYDEEISYGAFLRLVKNNWITRLDLDYNRTGNTFLSPLPIAYEQVNLRQRNYSASFGSYFLKYLYVLVGVTYTQNEGNIEQYTTYPFDYEFQDSFGPCATIGIEKSFDRFFTFLEYRRIFSDMEVRIAEDTITEDTENSTIYFGWGVKW